MGDLSGGRGRCWSTRSRAWTPESSMKTLLEHHAVVDAMQRGEFKEVPI